MIQLLMLFASFIEDTIVFSASITRKEDLLFFSSSKHWGFKLNKDS